VGDGVLGWWGLVGRGRGRSPGGVGDPGPWGVSGISLRPGAVDLGSGIGTPPGVWVGRGRGVGT
jgi:hypothetical protein